TGPWKEAARQQLNDSAPGAYTLFVPSPGSAEALSWPLTEEAAPWDSGLITVRPMEMALPLGT
ncbi:MAG: hypothetical protein M3Y27_11725, partial [Acidobacteriota bacterium]|nr:hypothetical protein [Acidobacteriota bacterium]